MVPFLLLLGVALCVPDSFVKSFNTNDFSDLDGKHNAIILRLDCPEGTEWKQFLLHVPEYTPCWWLQDLWCWWITREDL